MEFFAQPALDVASSAIFTLATGIAVKYPVSLSGPVVSVGQSAFRINRHIVRGDVPVTLTDVAATAGSFWYNHETGQIQEYLDVRKKHVIEGNTLNGVEITVTDHSCITTSQWLTAPEFSQYITGNGCAGPQVIPARTLGAWLKIGTTGVENVALPQNESFNLIAIMNMVSVAFYLLVTVSSFKKKLNPLRNGIEDKLMNALACASGIMVVYAACYDVVLDTQCTQTEAALVAIPMCIILLLLAQALKLKSSPRFDISNAKLLIVSSVSLSLSISVLDYVNTNDFYALTATIVNCIAALAVLLIISKSNASNTWQVTLYERAILEIAIISSLRLLVQNELGELFALATSMVVAIIVSKYCFPKTLA